MTEEDNTQIVFGLVRECVNTNRLDALDFFVHRAVRVHPGTPGTAPVTEGLQQLQEAFRQFHDIFPDLHIALQDVFTAGDRVAGRWIASGTHTTALAGIPATGRHVCWGGIDIYRLLDGKIVEWWRNDDFAGLLKQLGRDPLAPSDPNP